MLRGRCEAPFGDDQVAAVAEEPLDFAGPERVRAGGDADAGLVFAFADQAGSAQRADESPDVNPRHPAGQPIAALFVMVVAAAFFVAGCGDSKPKPGSVEGFQQALAPVDVSASMAALQRAQADGRDLRAPSRNVIRAVERARDIDAISSEEARRDLEDSADAVAADCGYCAGLLNDAADRVDG